MFRKVLLVFVFCVVTTGLMGQRVGLVLSGGGAKGLYHIGLIKALEEHNIPIDYISGTSMGSIVAGLYAIGFTPQEMEELFLSDKIKRWLSGKIEDRYYFFFKRMDQQNGSMLTLRLDFKDKKSIARFPTNVVLPYQMDLAFMEFFASPTAQSQGNFDRLFVPFRCVASDVYNKKELVFKSGDVGEAIRMSMTIPLVFKPLKRDSVLIYDGGIYNNFPWKVLEEDFSPDVFIGGKCVAGLRNPDENNIIEQVEAITMMHTDFELPEGKSVLVERIFSDVGTLDFSKAQYIIDQGYADAIAKMPEIEAQIARRVSAEELAARRQAYRSQLPELIFERYDIKGLNGAQRNYIQKLLNLGRKTRTFTYDQFKSEYFKILSEGEIQGDFPRTHYNDTTGKFAVSIAMKTEPNFRIMLGGNISSTSQNQAYMGIQYRRIGTTAQTYGADGYFSQLYSSVRVGGRCDFFIRSPFYADLYYTFNHYNYFKGNTDLFYKDRKSQYYKYNDNNLSLSFGLPLGRSSVLSGRGTLGADRYHYFQTSDFKRNDQADKTLFNFYEFKIDIQKYTLNYLLYPTEGIYQTLSAVYVNGNERFRPGTRGMMTPDEAQKNKRWWFGGRFMREEYFKIAKWLNVGYSVDAVLSSHPNFDNMYATKMTQPGFTPTPHSKTLYMPEFRSNSYVGFGISPIFNFLPKLYLKNSVYLFMNEDYLKMSNIDTRVRYILNASLVYQTFIGPASVSLANYDGGNGRWYVVFNFGYSLFNKKGLSY